MWLSRLSSFCGVQVSLIQTRGQVHTIEYMMRVRKRKRRGLQSLLVGFSTTVYFLNAAKVEQEKLKRYKKQCLCIYSLQG
ncbi:hypothetical protein CUMW_010930 [Citrus unshiu]|nr:hypothetical protein CUMW_010930 [Citrus unshiu]